MSDAVEFVEFVRRLHADAGPPLRDFFSDRRPVVVARAPGRLDVMGGIADYSGSLVLQLPLSEATWVAAQACPDGGCQVVSLPVGECPRRSGSARHGLIAAEDWQRLLGSDYDTAREWFDRDPASRWTAYPLGTVLVLAKETGRLAHQGLRLLIHSSVPEGKGVSSSAALEVATMQAVSRLAGIELEGTELAQLCQLAENRVVGAPCGIMDQMTAAVGRAEHLLALLCQPAEVQGLVPIPKGIRFWGIDSGIRHAISGSDYTSVRTGAFMGYRIIAEQAGFPVRCEREGRVRIEDSRWNGYLVNVTPEEFERFYVNALPERMLGREFLLRFAGITDLVTRVEPDHVYAIRQPTAHPIYEHARVRRFRELLTEELSERTLCEMGQLMFQSHASYSACGLGSDGTDLLVELVRQAGPAAGLYGAKITGGGSGGTVAVLGLVGAGDAVRQIAERYSAETGRTATVFEGSSDGACRFGVRLTAQR